VRTISPSHIMAQVKYVGDNDIAALRFAVERLNATGGALGRKFELVVADSEMEADVSTRRANELILGEKAFVLPTLPLEARRQAQQDITRWLETGPRLHAIAGRFPLDDTARAHATVEAGTKLGTVVVLCRPAAAAN
jgi:NADPH:quinone reductase-like Zn-dependent oxidoreductase